MTGQFIAKRLKKSGNYISALDFDKSFVGKDNPKGLFKMVVQPIENCDGNPEIRFLRVASGVMVSGEAYIISAATEEEIDDKIRKEYACDKWPALFHREVFLERDLW